LTDEQLLDIIDIVKKGNASAELIATNAISRKVCNLIIKPKMGCQETFDKTILKLSILSRKKAIKHFNHVKESILLGILLRIPAPV
jgi:hypothetical protein